ncbi:tripartite tricarboxylate transporter TctB family protein [Halomonas marinisediminis]|uniref:Tripartite tricarboxylate transporter TctB family protein n=1 Tax=Halomonas marinisediminis TaxID=2546095 RepID=A0ABY2D827_9GAMM|nr:tripartite tricarboxylate transporter TctB family protein [Halomonas marinisediminis]TDB03214.1 tripartite tricarboxylate transporter TctB family protein [Halomonas marinisediminis]
MFALTKDRALSLALLIVSAVLFIESRNIPPPTSWQPYGSALFPRILLVVVAALSVILLVRSLATTGLEKRCSKYSVVQWIKNNVKILSLFGLFGLYTFLLPLAGYLISTFFFLSSSLALLMGVDTWRKWLINLSLSFSIVPLVYIVFRFGLNVWLP